MMRDLPSIKENNEVCEGCLLGKQHRFPFSTSGAWRAKDLLELIHTDVCGPMRTPSHENNKYFILFIDDFSRMTWVYFLKEKSEVFGVFKKFKALAENQSGKWIKVLRSDRGKEYTSREFERFCEDEGIERQLTVAYSPQQNGVFERKNRTVMANKVNVTVLEHDVGSLSTMRKYGYKVYYGDATDLNLLRAAGAEHAKAIVITSNEPEATMEIVHLCQRHFPQLQIIARARGRVEAHELLKAGVTEFSRETFSSALELGRKTLIELGMHPHQAYRAQQHFRRLDMQLLRKLVD